MKLCSSCRKQKPLESFHKLRCAADGHQYHCKECQKDRVINAHSQNPDRRSAYYKKWLQENSDVKRASRKNYNEKNRARRREYAKDYKSKNRDRLKTARGIRDKARRKEDIRFRIQNNLRGRMWYALKRSGRKIESAIALVGCDMSFLKRHLESQFENGMTWENHSLSGWHIDHKKPCCDFDLSKPEQQKECFHWSNLRPLWSRENCAANQYHQR